MSKHRSLSIPKSKQAKNRQISFETEYLRAIEDDTFKKPSEELPWISSKEPYNEMTSFFSETTGDRVYTAICISLKEQPDIDIEFHETSYKFRGRKFMNNNNYEMCEFQIEMYKTKDSHPSHPGHVLVEFQRRSGDLIAFQNFLSNIMNRLNHLGVVSHSKYPFLDNNNNNNNNKQEQKTSNDNNSSLLVFECSLTTPPVLDDEKKIDVKKEEMLQMLKDLFFGYRDVKRSAACFLAENIVEEKNSGCVNKELVEMMFLCEPEIVKKIRGALLNCLDAQVINALGYVLFNMVKCEEKMEKKGVIMKECESVKMRQVCSKVQSKWLRNKYCKKVQGRNGKIEQIENYVSHQVAYHMQKCIEVMTY